MLSLKALGLALSAVFAVSAVVAAGAQAEVPAHFTGGPYLTTTQDDHAESTIQAFSTVFGNVECDMVKAKGQTPSTTSDTATFTEIEYFGTPEETTGPCEAFGLEAETEFNSCHYTFHAGTWNGTDATGTFDIQCTEPGDAIEIIAGGGLCEISFPPQNGLNNVTYTNEEATGDPESITVHINSNNTEYEGSGGLCEGVFEGGELFGTQTISGYSDAAHTNRVPITVGPSNT